MNELEIYKRIHFLQKEEILLLRKSLEGYKIQIEHLQKLYDVQEKIILLQKAIIGEFTPKAPVPHLKLVKDE